MADDPNAPDVSGLSEGIPPAPGDFSETIPDKSKAKPGQFVDPFTPLTPAQELDERTRLNFEAVRRGGLLGSAQAADVARQANVYLPTTQRAGIQSDIADTAAAAGFTLPGDLLSGGQPNFDQQQETAKEQLAKMQADQLAYENMPAYKGVVEGVHSLLGTTGGMFTSPENFLFPEVKLGSVAWRAAHPFMTDVIGWGLGQAAIGGPANTIVQLNQIQAGLKKEFDPVEATLAFPMSAAFGGGLAGLNYGAKALYRYTNDAITKWAIDGVMSRPTLTPEVKPPIPPEPPRAPADTFDIGATQQVQGPVRQPIVAGMPTVQEGNVRLYRAETPADANAKHLLFSQEQFPGANEYIDVREDIAAQMVAQGGDRVSLPIGLAAARQKMPTELLTEAAAKVDPYRNLTRTEATPAGEQGVLPGTEHIGMGEQAQRAADRPLQAQADQQAAGGLFGETGRQVTLDERAAELARAKEPPPPVAKNPVESRALQYADMMEATGPEGANFAKGIRGAVRGGVLKEESLPFYEQKLASFRQQAGTVAERPNETATRTLTNFLDEKHQTLLAQESASWPTAVRGVIADAQEAFTEAVRKLNAEGLKLSDAPTSIATKPVAAAAQKSAMEIGGATSRLLNGIKWVERGKNKVTGEARFATERVKKDIELLRETIVDSRKPVAEPPPVTPTKAGRKPQTFTKWVAQQGGLIDSEELQTIYGGRRVSVVRPAEQGGKTLDNILEAAVQQKWLPEGTDRNVILSMLDDEARKVTTHYHPAEGHVRPTDQKFLQAEGDVDAVLHEIQLHPSQVTDKKAKIERNAIRDEAINDVYRNEKDPETAVIDAASREGEHGRAAEGHPPFDDGVDIPFDTEPTPAAGRPVGEAGAPELGGQPPADRGAPAPSTSEARIAKRLKGMAGQGIGVAPGQTHVGPAGVAAASVPAGPRAPLENLQNMMRRISDELNLIVRRGVHEKGALGTYDFKTHIIRLNEMGPDAVSTWAHELGHHVENVVGKPVTDLIAANPQSMKAFAGTMGNGLSKEELAREGFGEFMSGYITNQRTIELKDPKFIKDFRTVMAKENPKLLATLDDAHNSFEIYNGSDPGTVVDSMVVTHGDIPKPQPNDPLQRGPLALWFSEFYLKYVNKQHPMTLAVRYLAREYNKKHPGMLLDLRPDEDPRALAQILGGGAGFQKTMMDLTYGIQSMRDLKPEGPSLISILRRATADPLTGAEARTSEEVLARKRSFDGYLIARWHLELRRQMSNGEIELTRMPTAMTDGAAVRKVAEMDKLRPDWAGLAEELYAVNKIHAKLRFENGLDTADQYADKMHPRNARYVPLNRDMRGISDALGVGGNFTGDKILEEVGVGARTGSGRNILSPTESIMHQLAETNEVSNQNMIARALRDLVDRVGGPEGARLAEMVPNHEMRALDIRVNEAVYRAAIGNGWNPIDAKDLVKNLQQQLGMDIRTKLYHSEAIKAGNQPIIFGWENGERFAMRLPDGEFGRQLVETMDSLGPQGMQDWAQATGLVIDVLTASASTLRAGATMTPTFMMKNFMRDAFNQFLLVPEAGYNTLLQNIRGGASYLRGDDFYRWYISTGGIQGGVGAASLSRSKQQVEFEKAIQRFQDPSMNIKAGGSVMSPANLQASRAEMAKTLQIAGVETHQQVFFGNVKDLMQSMEISESAGRIGLFRSVYEADIAMGRDHRYAMFDAAMKARDFIDYGRRGSKMEMISRMVPFLNANVQGVEKFFRTYFGTPSQPGMFFKPFTAQQAAYQQSLRTALIPRISALAAISAGITYIYEDDPVYQRLSNQQRSQYWIFRVPFLKSGTYSLLNGDTGQLPDGMQGAWVFIPKPWEPGTVFNLAERATQFLHSGDPDHLAKALDSIRYSFSVPSPIDFPLVRSSMGLASNYDTFFDRPIVPQALQRDAPHLQSNEYTHSFYVALARGLNMVWNSQDAHTWFRKNMPYVGALLAAPWSPMEAQYLMQGTFGDWPRELGGIGGIARSLINGEVPNISDVPALRAFIKTRMAMGEPMNETYNQIGQNGGRLTIANNTFNNLIKAGDTVGARQYFNTAAQDLRDYIRVHQDQGGPLANVIHPLDRTSALASVTRTIKNGLLSDQGMATLKDPNARILLEPGMRDVAIQIMNEYTATEARNGLIVQGASGYKNMPLVDTKPYLDTLAQLSPQLGRELSARLAQSKVMPISTIEQFWPQAQKLLEAGESVNPKQLSLQLKVLSQRAASLGYEGGGRRAGRGAVDVGGVPVKRGKTGPVSLPAEQ